MGLGCKIKFERLKLCGDTIPLAFEKSLIEAFKDSPFCPFLCYVELKRQHSKKRGMKDCFEERWQKRGGMSAVDWVAAMQGDAGAGGAGGKYPEGARISTLQAQNRDLAARNRDLEAKARALHKCNKELEGIISTAIAGLQDGINT